MNVLDSGLRGEIEDVTGIVFTNSCDGMRRLYDVWPRSVKTDFTFMLEVPRNRDEHAVCYFAEQLGRLKKALEAAFDLRISTDDLERAILHMNGRREMVLELFEKQKASPTPYKGSNLLKLCLQEMRSTKHGATGKIRIQPQHREFSDNPEEKPPRIMIMGNMIDRPNLFKMVETGGASVKEGRKNCHGERDREINTIRTG